MLQLPHTGVTPDMLGEIQSLLGVVGLDRRGADLDLTEVPEEVARYIVAVVRRTRENPGLELGASSRAAIHLLSASKATGPPRAAATSSRSTTCASVAPYVLRHRLICRHGHDADDALQAALDAQQIRARRWAARRPDTAPLHYERLERAPVRVSTRARCIRNSADAAVSLDGSVPSAA